MIAGLKEDSRDRLILRGDRLKASISNAIIDGGMGLERTMNGGSTLSLTLADESGDLQKRSVFNQRSDLNLDGIVFELAALSRSDSFLTVTFEDAVIADLRKWRKVKKSAAKTTTRTRFVRQVLDDAAKYAEFLGYPGDANLKALHSKKRENGWALVERLAQERQWRAFADQNTLYFGPDVWLAGLGQPLIVRKGEAGVLAIDYDYDVRKPVATASIRCLAKRWAARPGKPVRMPGLGEAMQGIFLVETISRDLNREEASVTVVRKQPQLPEPKPDPVDHDDRSEGGGSGTSGKPGATSAQGFQWPVSGPVTSGFGPRGSSYHYGIDIGVPTGTPVKASKPGRVSFAGVLSGYGNVVYVTHEGGWETRYAHLSAFGVRAGQEVGYSTIVGNVGATGNASGPHLHLEHRRGGVAVNPISVLP